MQTAINQTIMNQTKLNRTSMTSNKSMIAEDKKNDNDEEDFNFDKIHADSRWLSDFNRVTGDLIKYSFKFVNMNSYLHENTKLILFNYITENCIKLCIYDAHLKKKKHEKSIDLRIVRLPWHNNHIFQDQEYRDSPGNKNDIDLNKVLNKEDFN